MGASSAIANALEAIHRRAGAERSVSDSSGVTVPSSGQPHAARLAAARTHVFGERGELGEIFLDAVADEGARALAAHQQPFRDQAVDGLAHGDARDTELVGEIALGRQRVVGRR